MSGLPRLELLQAILDRAHITDWDVLIVGDGSGTGWEDANAYASVLIDRETRGRKTCWGGNRWGSINLAEMEAYLKPLLWFDNAYGRERLKRKSPIYVDIVTDSQVTCSHGARAADLNRELPDVSHRPMWAAMRELARMGYYLRYHWAPRNTSGLNMLSDLVAGLSRSEMLSQEEATEGLALRVWDAVRNLNIVEPTGLSTNAYDINPDEAPTNGPHDAGSSQ